MFIILFREIHGVQRAMQSKLLDTAFKMIAMTENARPYRLTTLPFRRAAILQRMQKKSVLMLRLHWEHCLLRVAYFTDGYNDTKFKFFNEMRVNFTSEFLKMF